MSAPDEVVERAEQYGRELDDLSADTLARAGQVVSWHRLTATACACGWPRGRGGTGSLRWSEHVAAELAAAGLLADADDRPDDAPSPRPARRFGSFAVSGGPRRLTDEEGGS